MRFWTALALLALLAAACGDSGETTTTTTVPAGTVAAPTTVTTAAPPTTVAATTTTVAETTTTVSTLPSSDIFVTTVGLGEVRVGMTVEEAEEASGLTLAGEPEPAISDNCYFVEPADAPGYEGISFMVLDDEIARVDVVPPSTITTRSGAGIGTTAQQLEALFPGQIEDASEFTIDGAAVMFVPRDETDARFRVIFDLLDGAVVAYRSGVLPGVGYGEGCL